MIHLSAYLVCWTRTKRTSNYLEVLSTSAYQHFWRPQHFGLLNISYWLPQHINTSGDLNILATSTFIIGIGGYQHYYLHLQCIITVILWSDLVLSTFIGIGRPSISTYWYWWISTLLQLCYYSYIMERPSPFYIYWYWAT